MPAEAVQALQRLDRLDDSANEALRFPLSASEPREHPDHLGASATVIDCVFNASVVRHGAVAMPVVRLRLSAGMLRTYTRDESACRDSIADPRRAACATNWPANAALREMLTLCGLSAAGQAGTRSPAAEAVP